jgi:hypothetical protein
VKADVTTDSRVVSSRSTSARRGQWLVCCAGAGLMVILTTGCHYVRSHHAAEPHYGRLEQACFGYEPTVWRSLPGDCEQAVRMIPDEVVQLPAAAPAPAQPALERTPDDQVPLEPDAAPETETAPPDENRVPGVLRGILEGATPPADQPTLPDNPPPAMPQEPAVEPPAATPPAVEPVVPPAVEPATAPGTEPAAPPAVEPAAPPAAPPATEPASDLRQSRTRQVRPVSTRSEDQDTRLATDAAAQDLFRSVAHALAVTPSENATQSQPQNAKAKVVVEASTKTPPPTRGTIGLARFIY